ncbi:alanine--tRNA ligase-related protein [uncultured Merdimonas sp.]|uniref:alanyl-tRNA editing protein n=1 Tax=uncultured Merdimonas sp. TaxID=2023269 RepID=UPI00320BA4DE
MRTEKLYYQDSHRSTFEAKVLSCEQEKDGYRIVLDRTVFFPEGGGQYADPGFLDQVEVTDVHEKDGVVYHYTREPLEPGQEVKGRILWDVRFERMQQHTGEHIVSGLVHQKFGYDNVGFHLGEDYCTMDFNGPITREELKQIERMANKAVFQDLDVISSFPSEEERSQMEYRSKIELTGPVQIITIPGYDVCACCAPHMKKTGEIGLIKLVHMDHYKGGERITMLAGIRALRDYEEKEKNVKEISALLCAKERETAEAVSRLKEEHKEQKERLASLQQKLLRYQADEIQVEEHTLVFDSGLSGNGPRELMNLLLNRGAKIALVFAGNDTEGYRYVIGSRSEDVRPVGKMLNQAFNGRGGGKKEMIQGSLTGTEAAIRHTLGS